MRSYLRMLQVRYEGWVATKAPFWFRQFYIKSMEKIEDDRVKRVVEEAKE